MVTPDFFGHNTVDCSQNVSAHWLYDGTMQPANLMYTPLEYTTLPGQVDDTSASDWSQSDICSNANALLANATQGNLQRLSNEECINTYGPDNSQLSHRGNLLAVTKGQPANNANGTILLTFRYEVLVTEFTGNNWVCDPTYLNDLDKVDPTCDWQELAQTANSSWYLGEYLNPSSNTVASSENPPKYGSGERWEIDYCLSQQTELGGQCMLQYSLVIMICVLVANSIKFACIFFFLHTSGEPVLATIGDGISTFLERPDTTTAGRPFLNRQQARKFSKLPASSLVEYHNQTKPLRWWHGPSKARWSITLSLCTIAICVTIYLLSEAAGTGAGFSSFGSYNPLAVLDLFASERVGSTSPDSFSSNSDLLSAVAVANLPQVLVSCLYFAYNTVYTSMVSADEWSRFTTQRKTLRTTDPKGLQRSTYWLSLPWTYALPLAAASSMLHWLISQALFVTRTEILSTDGVVEPVSYMVIGFSPLAILLALLFGGCMVIGMVINGGRKVEGRYIGGKQQSRNCSCMSET